MPRGIKLIEVIQMITEPNLSDESRRALIAALEEEKQHIVEDITRLHARRKDIKNRLQKLTRKPRPISGVFRVFLPR